MLQRDVLGTAEGTPADEARGIAEAIAKHVCAGVAAASIAVLFRFFNFEGKTYFQLQVRFSFGLRVRCQAVCCAALLVCSELPPGMGWKHPHGTACRLPPLPVQTFMHAHRAGTLPP